MNNSEEEINVGGAGEAGSCKMKNKIININQKKEQQKALLIRLRKRDEGIMEAETIRRDNEFKVKADKASPAPLPDTNTALPPSPCLLNVASIMQ